ncbi:GNAT family protein [Marinobacter nanhaiticus D15-8W]|uniref:N-acetyltransferase n=1 Tax=Marinobacter nanhaiticus D15-8W TaxID=626887 RepID=N6WWD7_9GAMM|nr:GNAT family protein [Marinobacter nanhaiticus]ENO15362.1 N-acetyltransferase [Marinobacter nanhaiticus D15-8W]BES73792.1 GNAT family protein [Marinobacter nanhaiticus D15-8W]
MSKWLDEVKLVGESASLIPLSPDHRDPLVKAATDGLWELWFTGAPSADTVDRYIETALAEKAQGVALPFVVVHNPSGEIIGSTRYCNADPDHRRLEIGYTWYAKRFQRTTVNTECKQLLLAHAFESLETIAVEFRTHWHNEASRRAIARLGAKQDGVLRNHKIEPDGAYRDTVVFSILEHEWPTVKKSLAFKLARLREQG